MITSIKLTSKVKVFMIICSIVFVSCISLWLTVSLITKNRIFPDVSICGVEIGGLTQISAINLVSSKIKAPQVVVVQINNNSYEINSDKISLTLNYEGSVKRAFFTKRSNNGFKNLFYSLWIFGPKTDIDVVYEYNKESLNNEIDIIRERVEERGEKPSVSIVNNEIVVNPGKDGLYIDVNDLISKINTSLGSLQKTSIQIPLIPIKMEIDIVQQKQLADRADTIRKKLVKFSFEDYAYQLKGADIVPYIEFPNGFNDLLTASVSAEISLDINRDPQDSVFVFDGGKVKEFLPSKTGVSLDKNLFINVFNSALNEIESTDVLQKEIGIPVVEVMPKITTESINNMGIKEVVGKGTSYFRGSIPSRIHNIDLASSKINGTIIPPGDTFSFNLSLGEVSALTGFQQAYVIRGNETVLGDGGGVCQVSTTLFRAALYSGLPIIERSPHSYRVSYYEQGSSPGLDATVYEPSPDFKFKNDTGNHILIQSIFNKKELSLTFELYGSSDGRIATISKPIITSVAPPPDDLYIDDPTLPLGTIKQIEHKAWGAKVVFDYEVKKDDQVIFSKKFISNYRPWQAKYLKGTKTL